MGIVNNFPLFLFGILNTILYICIVKQLELMKVLLKYKQRERKPSPILVERWGMKVWEHQSGFVDYDQEEMVEADKLDARVKELKSFTNRNYHSFTVK